MNTKHTIKDVPGTWLVSQRFLLFHRLFPVRQRLGVRSNTSFLDGSYRCCSLALSTFSKLVVVAQRLVLSLNQVEWFGNGVKEFRRRLEIGMAISWLVDHKLLGSGD